MTRNRWLAAGILAALIGAWAGAALLTQRDDRPAGAPASTTAAPAARAIRGMLDAVALLVARWNGESRAPDHAPAVGNGGASTTDENAQRVVAILRGLTAAEEQVRALREQLDGAPSQGERGRRER